MVATWRHGASGYRNYGCRCDVCRTAWAAYHSEWRRRHVRAGGCAECGRPTSGYRCEQHAEGNRVRMRGYKRAR